MKKVSFDFDGTLSRNDIQEYAKELLDRGIDVWICTSRTSPKDSINENWNDDLFLIADKLGIKRENIIFTSYANKSEHLNNKGFSWHIDDDNIELSFIRTDTNIIPIFLFGNKEWKNDCESNL